MNKTLCELPIGGTSSALTGYSLAEVRGHHVWDFLLIPGEVEPVMAVFVKLRTTELTSAFTNYWITKTGERRWIAWSHTLSPGPGGQVQYIVKTGIDRTESKLIANALHLADARLSGIIEIAADAIITIDNQHRIVIYNRAAETIFGWSAAEAMGKPLDLLLPARCRAVHGQQVRNFGSGSVTARHMGEREVGISGRRKNGEEFPAQAAISKLDVDGTQWLTVVLRDVTEQKQQEKERERLYQDALRATRMRDDVLGIVAHDLRSPLSTILLQTNLLQRQQKAEPDARSDKPLETIERVARRMNRLIQDLLEVTQIDAGKLSIERARVPSAPLIQDTLVSQRLRASSVSLDLRSEVSDELPDIWADRDRLMQVFENLVGNALKFTESGGSVTIGSKSGNGEVLFSVADTGAGITPEQVPHLFDRFWQSGKADRRGAGLGLAIVKGIVEAHGGRIWVESTLGAGSTFSFTIPTSHTQAASRDGA